MLKKFIYIIFILFIFFPSKIVFSGESGDEEEINTPKLTVIKNDNDLETQPVNLNKEAIQKLTLLKEPRDIEDPFNKDLPMLIKYRGIYSNAEFYSLESLILIGILSSGSISGKDMAIFLMPDQRQLVASVGQTIGKEKAVIQAINKNDILLKVQNQNIIMVKDR